MAFGKGRDRTIRDPPPPHWTPERAAALQERGPHPSDKALAMSYGGYDLRVLKDGSCQIVDILDKARVYATIRLKSLCQNPEDGCDLDALLALLMPSLTLLFGNEYLDPRYAGAMFHLDQTVRALTGRSMRTRMRGGEEDLCRAASTP
jgi:hypothetical protein